MRARSPDRGTATSPRPAYLLGFVALGLSLSMVGPAMSHLRERAGFGLGAGGLLLAAQGVGYVAASLTIGHRLDRGGGHRILVASAAGAVVAAASVLGMHAFAPMVVAFAAIGACGGGIDVTANTLLVWHEHPSRVGPALNALHLCFGLGAIASPLVVAASLSWLGDLSLVVVALGVLAATIAAVVVRCETPVRRDHDDVVFTPTPHRRRILVLAALFFVLYVGSEGTFGAWCATYGEALGMSWSSGPAVLTAVFWVGFSAGRVAAIVATRRGAVDAVLVASCAAATFAALVLAAGDGSLPLVWAMTGVLGFTLGPQYATMLAAADRRIRLDGRSTSRLIGAAGIGGLALPMATGWILDRAGADALPFIVAAGAAAALAVVAALVADRHPPHTWAAAPVAVVVLAVAGVALAGCTGGSDLAAGSTATTGGTEATTTVPSGTRGDVDRLAVAEPGSVPDYRRAAFLDDWDYDPATGCSTRERVLIEESIVPATVDDRCRPTGRWRSPYDGRVTTDPADLEIDHRVPLADAWRAGAWRWTPERRHAFATDLTDPNTLVAVTSSTNRSKSDSTPDQWLPPDPADRCAYAQAWVEVKVRWALTVTPAEKSTLVQVLSGC